MAYSHRMSCTIAMALFIFFHYCISSTSAKYAIGVCYGMQGDNLPAPVDVINLFGQYGIERIRIYDPNTDVLEALKGSKLLVSLGVRNEDIPNLSSGIEEANTWVSTFVLAYTPNVEFKYISVGNEVIPGENDQHVASAIQNIHDALAAAGIDTIKVSTVVSSGVLAASSPPSQGVFTSDAMNAMASVVSVLSDIGSPLMANVYPYFAYAADPAHISFPFAAFTSGSPVQDGNLAYWNLFDAMVDAFYWAMEKAGVTDVGIVVTETGWPTAGNGNFTTPDLALVYNTNLKNHVMYNGTPKRPSSQIDTFIFAMFNENLKQPSGIEQNWGIFYPDKTPVYTLF